MAVTTDHPTYRFGETVQANAAVRNRSDATCNLPDGYSGTLRFERPSGKPIVTPGNNSFIGNPFGETPLAAGAVLTLNATWNQASCDYVQDPSADSLPSGFCLPVPPGTYTAKATLSFAGVSVDNDAAFQLLAG